MKPKIRKFSRQFPCTVEDVWNCFVGLYGFQAVVVPVAHALIGEDVPKHMRQVKRLVRKNQYEHDIYELTPEGKAWLVTKMQTYMRRNPDVAISLVPDVNMLHEPHAHIVRSSV